MSYVAGDAQVLTHAPFIAQFSLTCKGKPVNDLPLYYASKVDGGFVQVCILLWKICRILFMGDPCRVLPLYI